MSKTSSLLKSKKIIILCAIIASVGIILLLFPTENQKTDESEIDTSINISTYTEKLEERIKALCEAVNGVGTATVFITIDSGSEFVYADNVTEELRGENESSYSSDYLIIETKDGTSPVKIAEIYPKIRGVAVVCSGKSSAVTEAKLTELLSAALGISTSKVKVLF